MMISDVVYFLRDWIAQCNEGKPLFEFDQVRMLRSEFVGLTLRGSLSHYYYHLCEPLFPFQEWWVVPVKVVFDQTAWSGTWNIILGFMRFESPSSSFGELKATFWPLLTVTLYSNEKSEARTSEVRLGMNTRSIGSPEILKPHGGYREKGGR